MVVTHTNDGSHHADGNHIWVSLGREPVRHEDLLIKKTSYSVSHHRQQLWVEINPFKHRAAYTDFNKPRDASWAFIFVSDCHCKTDSSKELNLISIESFIPDTAAAQLSAPCSVQGRDTYMFWLKPQRKQRAIQKETDVLKNYFSQLTIAAYYSLGGHLF